MKTSRKVEILKAAIDAVNRDENCFEGLCHHILYNNSYPDREESKEIKKFLNENKPRRGKHSEFYIHDSYIDGRFWWVLSKEGHKQRTFFLEKLIRDIQLPWWRRIIENILR